MKIAIIIPTYNAEKVIEPLLDSMQQQTVQPEHLIIVDSSSTDATTAILEARNIKYHSIKKTDFNHGTTRKYATTLADADIYILLTQDVKFANKDAIENILKAFTDKKIGCAYGRQLPYPDADIVATHLRLFVYPTTSSTKSYTDRESLGINTCMNSDNFAAYRKVALTDIGGFPENIPLSEDMYIAAKMLMQGWNIAYRADALIYHSHNHTLAQEFKRYFDIGTFHAMNPWIFATFKSNWRESIKYLHSALPYCIDKQAYFAIPTVIFNIFAKLFGFLAGKHYQLLPLFVRKKLSTYNS